MAERHVIHFLRGREIRTHQAANFFSSRIVSDWSVELETFAVFGDIKFPADPGNGVALAHQKAVAIFAFRTGRTEAVHKVQNSFSAAIGNFEKHGAVSLVHVLGLQQIEVSGKFDFALRIARRFVEIDDQLVVKIVRIHREINAADNFLVSSSQSEGTAIQNVGARNNLDARNMRVSTGSGKQKYDKRQESERHARAKDA